MEENPKDNFAEFFFEKGGIGVGQGLRTWLQMPILSKVRLVLEKYLTSFGQSFLAFSFFGFPARAPKDQSLEVPVA